MVGGASEVTVATVPPDASATRSFRSSGTVSPGNGDGDGSGPVADYGQAGG